MKVGQNEHLTFLALPANKTIDFWLYDKEVESTSYVASYIF